jgi:hypothetical protein
MRSHFPLSRFDRHRLVGVLRDLRQGAELPKKKIVPANCMFFLRRNERAVSILVRVALK